MKIDHICFAVRDLKDGIAYWEHVFGYKQMTKIVKNSLQKVKVAFMSKDDSITIKLIEPTKDNKSLMNFVSMGGGFHHICFKCHNIEEKIIELNKKGLKTLVPPQKGEAFNNNRIAFMFGRFGLNLELIDTKEKAGML